MQLSIRGRRMTIAPEFARRCARGARFAVLLALVAVGQLGVRAETAPDDTAVRNLAAFARVYGYVRFFHPSDEAAATDWSRFAILGAEEVRGAASPEALTEELRALFVPVAPSLRLGPPATFPEKAPAAEADGKLTFWQYGGIKLGNEPGAARQRRVITGETKGERRPFLTPVEVPPAATREILPGVTLQLPTALPVGPDGKTRGGDPAAFAALQARLAAIDLDQVTAADWRVRVAAVIEVWNVFQHFHPYLSQIGVDWDAALEPALRSSLHGQDGNDEYLTLMELVAKSGDGHGYVYGRPEGAGRLPIRVDVVQDHLVVTRAPEGSPFRRGDVIERYNGLPALQALEQIERFTPGSPPLRRYRALNQFAEGAAGSTVKLDLVRDGVPQTVQARLEPARRQYFFAQGEFDFPALKELRPGIFYVNHYACDLETFTKALPQLANARGVIFDNRITGGSWVPPAEMIQETRDLIPHLIRETVQASPMRIPRITRPDRQGWTYFESTFPVKPAAPLFKGRVVIINEPNVVSYGETVMAILADYGLTRQVGAPTAGCNGGANFIPLPAGFRVMWTGMDVRKHDHSPFYGVGFPPDYPVARTIEAVKQGRDEYLEKAIEVLETEAPDRALSAGATADGVAGRVAPPASAGP